jgi:hypothetical protein
MNKSSGVSIAPGGKLGIVCDDEEQERRILAELMSRAHFLPESQLLELEMMSLFAAEWLRRERLFSRARRFIQLARECRNVAAITTDEPLQ